MSLNLYLCISLQFFWLFWVLFSLPLTYWPRRLCMRHPRWRLQCVAGHCYYHRSVFFFFFFPPVFCFWHTSGKLPCVTICFPQYFGITRRYAKKIFLGGKFNFFLRKKKLIFRPFFFFFFMGSVWSRPPGPPAVPGVLIYFSILHKN